MKISYHGDVGQAYVELTDTDIAAVQDRKQLFDDDKKTFDVGSIDPTSIDNIHFLWDQKESWKLQGVVVSQELFQAFLNESTGHYVERLGSLSVELIKR